MSAEREPRVAAVRAARELQQVVLERLLAIAARDAEELQKGLRAEAERAHLQAELDAERRYRRGLEEMVSHQLIQRAKRLWDRMPLVKNAVKAVAKKLL